MNFKNRRKCLLKAKGTYSMETFVQVKSIKAINMPRSGDPYIVPLKAVVHACTITKRLHNFNTFQGIQKSFSVP